MYLTQFTLTFGPNNKHEKVISLPTTNIQEWNPTYAERIREMLTFLTVQY